MRERAGIVVSVVLSLLVATGGSRAVEPSPDLPLELEGVALGQSYDAVARRLDLHRLVPLVHGEERRYQLGKGSWNSDRVRRQFEERDLQRMEILFRRDLAVEIRVEYSDRREMRFETMAAELEERFGAPDRIQDSGPMRVGRVAAVTLFLWVRVWRWERGGRVLVVKGEHYGDSPAEEAPDRHTYVFTLSSG